MTLASVSSNVSGKVSGIGSFATARGIRPLAGRATTKIELPEQLSASAGASSIEPRITFSTLVPLLQQLLPMQLRRSLQPKDYRFQEKEERRCPSRLQEYVFSFHHEAAVTS